MKLTLLISFLINVLLINAASVTRSQSENSSSDYLITVPKVLTNEQDKVCLVWLNEQTKPTSDKFDVKIKKIGSDTVIEKVSTQLNSESTCVEIPTKKIQDQSRVELEITVAGKQISEKHEVQVRPVLNLVLIETSKPIYKPSETIKFNNRKKNITFMTILLF